MMMSWMTVLGMYSMPIVLLMILMLWDRGRRGIGLQPARVPLRERRVLDTRK